MSVNVHLNLVILVDGKCILGDLALQAGFQRLQIHFVTYQTANC